MDHLLLAVHRFSIACLVFCFVFVAPGLVLADEEVFSGPQAGEKLPAFKVRGVLGEMSGKNLDFVTQADGKPLVLIFVHEVSRPAIGFTRVLSTYTTQRAKDGLHTGIVWLDDDATTAENTLQRIQHALTPAAPIGVSLDGREGPGSYGLNRKVALTILLGKGGKVAANFALVQPSLQADLPKVVTEIVRVAGGTMPKPEEWEKMIAMPGAVPAKGDPIPRSLLQPLLRKDANQEEIDQAAAKVEKHLEHHPRARPELRRIANTIVESGKLANYGNEKAQAYWKKWAKMTIYTDKEKTPKPDQKK